MAARKLSNWIGGYIEYTDPLVSPLRFRTWAAIAGISAALGHTAKVHIAGQTQFANLYVVLVGPPGTGKGNAIKPLHTIVSEAEIKLAPDSLSPRSFLSSMEAAHTFDIEPGTQEPLERYCELFAIINEFAVFVPVGDFKFQDTLLDIYDNKPIHHHKTEHYGENYLENPHFSFIAGTTPKSLRKILTDDSLETGFPSRLILVYSDEEITVDLFGSEGLNTDLKEALVHDLKQIKCLDGKFSWHPDASRALQEWYNQGLAPIPKDARFVHYNTRRLAHITKLCMDVSAAQSNDLIISLKDFEAARTTLLEAEQHMADAISALGGNPYLSQQQLAIKLINGFWEKNNSAMPEHVLRQWLSREVPPQYLNHLLEALTTAKWVQWVGERPSRVFWPRGQEWKGLQQGEEIKDE